METFITFRDFSFFLIPLISKNRTESFLKTMRYSYWIIWRGVELTIKIFTNFLRELVFLLLSINFRLWAVWLQITLVSFIQWWFWINWKFKIIGRGMQLVFFFSFICFINFIQNTFALVPWIINIESWLFFIRLSLTLGLFLCVKSRSSFRLKLLLNLWRNFKQIHRKTPFHWISYIIVCIFTFSCAFHFTFRWL